MAINHSVALMMVKTRLNRLLTDESLDLYFINRIQAAEQEINAMLPAPLGDSTADLILVVDYTVFSYQNRDRATGMPEGLRYRLRNKYLKKREAEANDT